MADGIESLRDIDGHCSSSPGWFLIVKANTDAGDEIEKGSYSRMVGTEAMLEI